MLILPLQQKLENETFQRRGGLDEDLHKGEDKNRGGRGAGRRSPVLEAVLWGQ